LRVKGVSSDGEMTASSDAREENDEARPRMCITHDTPDELGARSQFPFDPRESSEAEQR